MRRASPADFAFTGSKPRLGKFTQVTFPKTKPRPKPGPVTDHFGATSVASALSIRAGATPHGPIHPNMLLSVNPSKEDISTWQESGRFYSALTGLSGIVIKLKLAVC
jgi:hypothetical protein